MADSKRDFTGIALIPQTIGWCGIVPLLGERNKPNSRIPRGIVCRQGTPAGRIASGASSRDTGVNGTPCADTGGRSNAMFTRLFLTIFGAGIGLVVVAVPAHAEDAVEAKVQLCAACHGQNGVPTDPKTIPIIWGQERAYLFKQMRNYRNGERENAIMTPLAKAVAEEDLRKIAAYFAAKPWPLQKAAATPPPPPKGIAQCQPCHQPNFQGGPPAPRLAGLSYEYLVASMRSFSTEQRANNGDMPKFMQMLTESERDAIARYLSDL
jgi:cytochrome c553